jgi:hypothetical protein
VFKSIDLAPVTSMPFPISIDGTVQIACPLPEKLVPRVVEEIDALLSGELAKAVTVEGSVVRFRTGVWRRWIKGWSVLNPIGSGHLEVKAEADDIVVSYHLNMVPLLFLVTGFSAFFAALSWSTTTRYLFPALIWLWVFGGHYAITLFRFPYWLQAGLEDMPEIRRSAAAT